MAANHIKALGEAYLRVLSVTLLKRQAEKAWETYQVLMQQAQKHADLACDADHYAKISAAGHDFATAFASWTKADDAARI